MFKWLRFSFFFCTLFIACKHKNFCAYHLPKKIMAERTGINDRISYWHFILADSLYRDCMDSTFTMQMIKGYLKTAKVDLPVYKISLLNKIEDFDKGETLSQPKSFFRNVIADIYFDTITYNPQSFVFYNESGKEIYSGTGWDVQSSK